MKLVPLLLVAAVSYACTAAAADTVQVYGLLDVGVERINNIGADGSGVTRMSNLTGGQFPSRIGFRGKEQIEPGLAAVYVLESGIAPTTGSLLQSGRLFGRQAFVGLQSEWGTLSLGRHWTMAFFSLTDADVIGPASFSLYALDTYPANARVDNSISYKGKFQNWTVGATYSLGRDTLPPGNCAGERGGRSCTEWSALARYDTGTWGMALAVDELRGGGGAFAVIPGRIPVAAPSSSDYDRRIFLNGYLKFGQAKVGGGLVHRQIRAATDITTDLYFFGGSYPITAAVSVDAQFSTIRNSDMNADASMTVLRANYALSKRTSLYGLIGHVNNQGTASYSVSVSSISPASPAAGAGQTGLMIGMRHVF
ncbi:MAG TPA: porin [Noviherbaspirillum sp.]|nr:porin [Noviherbaspirillum sp.]